MYNYQKYYSPEIQRDLVYKELRNHSKLLPKTVDFIGETVAQLREHNDKTIFLSDLSAQDKLYLAFYVLRDLEKNYQITDPLCHSNFYEALERALLHNEYRRLEDEVLNSLLNYEDDSLNEIFRLTNALLDAEKDIKYGVNVGVLTHDTGRLYQSVT